MGFNSFMVRLTFPKIGICDDCNLNGGKLDGWEVDFGYRHYLCEDCVLIRKASAICNNKKRLIEHKKKLKIAKKIIKGGG